MSIVPFPDIIPTEVVSFTLPDYEVVINEDMEGIERRRSINLDARKATIRLRYTGLSSEDVLQFINHYKFSFPNNNSFGLTQKLYNYPDDLWLEFLKLTSDLSYLYNNRPIIQTDYSGLYRMDLFLQGISVDVFAPERVFVIRSKEALINVVTPEEFVQWEQISGIPVTIENPTNKSTRILSQGGDLTSQLGDLLFKVTLLSNPNIFRIVQVVTAPTTFDSIYGMSVYGTVLSLDRDNFKVRTPVRWNINNEDLNFVGKDGLEVLDITWDKPVEEDSLISYQVEIWNSELRVWEFYTAIPELEDPQLSIGAKVTFRIGSIHSIGGEKPFIVYSDVLNIDPKYCLNNSYGIEDFFPQMSTFLSTPFEVFQFDLEINSLNPVDYYPVHKTTTSEYATVTYRPLFKTDLDDLEEEVYDPPKTAYMSTKMVIVEIDLTGSVIG